MIHLLIENIFNYIGGDKTANLCPRRIRLYCHCSRTLIYQFAIIYIRSIIFQKQLTKQNTILFINISNFFVFYTLNNSMVLFNSIDITVKSMEQM